MKKSLSLTLRRIFVALSLLTVLSLSSCLNLETNMQLKRDGSVSTRITYTLSQDASQFGRGFGADEPWPFPLTERDFIEQSLRQPGTDVKRYRTGSNSDGSDWIRVDLKSDSIESLAAYLGMDMTAGTDGDSRHFTLTLPNSSSWNNADESLQKALSPLFDDSTIIISFQPPHSPEDAGIGQIDGRSAVLKMSLSELLLSENPTQWTVNW